MSFGVFFWKGAFFMFETERLIIRKYEKHESEHCIALFTDAVVMKNVDRGVLSTDAAEKLWNKLINEMYPGGCDTIYAVFRKEDGIYVGHASIRPRPEKPEDWEIGYILSMEHWGLGYATEIAECLIRFGFEEIGLREIFATIDDDNLNSIKVAKKIGMSFNRYEFDEGGRFSVYSISLDQNQV